MHSPPRHFIARRRFGLQWIVAFAIVNHSAANAQRPSGALWDSHQKAVTVLRDAADAAGGVDHIVGLTGIAYTWDGRDYFASQGRAPTTNAADTTGNGRPATYSYQVDYHNDRFLFEGAFAFAGGWFDIANPLRAPISIRIASDHKKSVQFDPSDLGSFYATDSTGAVGRATQNRFIDMAPLVLLRRAIGVVSSVRYLGADEHDGRVEDGIQFIEGDDRPRALYFDRATHLLTRTEKLGDGGSFGDEIDAVAFSDYGTADGLLVPKHAAEIWNGVVAGRFTLTTFAANTPLGDDVLRVPAEFHPIPPGGSAAGLRMNKMFDGTYLIEGLSGGYRSLVVDTDEGIVVVEAPVSVAANQAAIALIERTLPGRPITYLVVTHHHADHRAGIRAYAEHGATVLVSARGLEYVRQRAADPHTLNRLAVQPTKDISAQIVSTRAMRTIGSGMTKVEIIDVGPTLHSEDMLIAYVPAAKLLFSGDMVFANSRGVPSPSSREMADIIRKRGLAVDTLVTVHGANTTWSALDAATRP